MKILLLGGTKFLGRHIVEAALQRGHQLTLFHRGQTNPDLFPAVEKVHGDREKDLAALQGRSWDAVIDTSGYVPRIVKDAAEFLADNVGHYTFISSISVYPEEAAFETYQVDETHRVGTLQDPTVEEVTGETYGPLKALCEQAVLDGLPGRALIVRPGLIVGPDDPTDRFTYWPRRLALGGDVLAPDRKDQPTQLIDVRDLAEWIVLMVEGSQTGIYNATGPEGLLELEQVLEQCRVISGAAGHFVWVSEEFLEQHEVEPWTELPLWIPRKRGKGLSFANIQKACQAGLTFRPLNETIRDTLAWVAAEGPDLAKSQSMKPERELTLLREWQSR